MERLLGAVIQPDSLPAEPREMEQTGTGNVRGVPREETGMSEREQVRTEKGSG